MNHYTRGHHGSSKATHHPTDHKSSLKDVRPSAQTKTESLCLFEDYISTPHNIVLINRKMFVFTVYLKGHHRRCFFLFQFLSPRSHLDPQLATETLRGPTTIIMWLL